MFVFLSICLSNYLSIFLSVYFSVCLSVYVTECMLDLNGEKFLMASYNCTSNRPRPESYVEDFEVLSFCLFVCLFVCLFFCLSVYVSVCLT
jgi:hypothetical protein